MTRLLKIMTLAALLAVLLSVGAAVWFGPGAQVWVYRGGLVFVALAALVRASLEASRAVDDRQVLQSTRPEPLSLLRLVQHGGDTYIAVVVLTGFLQCAITIKLLLLSQAPARFVIVLGWALYWVAPWLANVVARIGGSVAAGLSYGLLSDHPTERLAVLRTGFLAVYALSVPTWKEQLTRWSAILRHVPDPVRVEAMLSHYFDALAQQHPPDAP